MSPKSVIQGRVGPIAEVSCPHFATSFSSAIRRIHPVISRRGSRRCLRTSFGSRHLLQEPVLEQSEHSTLYQRESHSARAVLPKTLARACPRTFQTTGCESSCLFLHVFSATSMLFPREIREVHFQPRVVRECRRRRPGSQTSRSRPPCFMVGAYHLSYWRDFSDVLLHVHASPAHVRVASRLVRWTIYLGRSLSRSRSSPTTT